MPTIAQTIVTALAELGVNQVWGVVGDALNPITDAIRREERVEWIGVRHEETAAFAACAQAQLSGNVGVCMGTVGPGSLHLLNGLYDARKSHAPVLAICGQVPRAEIGSDFFQEIDNDAVFADVSVFCRTLSVPEQMPRLLEQAVQSALDQRGVAVLTVPGDVGALEAVGAPPRFAFSVEPRVPPTGQLHDVAKAIDAHGKVTMLVGHGAIPARVEVLSLADALGAPMVLTLKAKAGLEHENPYQVGQSGLIGNPAAQHAFDECDLLLMLGSDFPYPEWYPKGKTVVQIDVDATHIGRRTKVDIGVVGDAKLAARALLEQVSVKRERSHLDGSVARYRDWRERQHQLTDPDHDSGGIVAKVRSRFDNPDERIRPEALALAVDQQAVDDAIFTSDTGMSTVWLSRFVTMRAKRKLIGSFNLGSMANAMPHALGAQALNRDAQVIAFCGDGGLTMLLGDILTAVHYDLAVKLIVFNNGRLGMVKLEQEHAGLPEFGTMLGDVDIAAIARAAGLHGVGVTDPSELDAAVASVLAHPGPALLDCVTNPNEISLPPRTKPSDAWGFAIAKITETLQSASS